MLAMWLSIWWVWICIALALGIVELLAPAFVFLGFALGALTMALAVLIVPTLGASAALALWAGLSLVAWLVLRRVFRTASSQVKVIHDDINDA